MEEGLLSLKWNNHKSTFFHVLSTLREKHTYTDVTLACDGRLYPAHKFVLSTCSEYFSDIFTSTTGNNIVIVLKDVRRQDLEYLLDYMYLGQVDVAQSELSSLIKTAECLRIKGLAIPDDEPQQTPRRGPEERDREGSPPSKKKRHMVEEDRTCSISSNNTTSRIPHMPLPPPQQSQQSQQALLQRLQQAPIPQPAQAPPTSQATGKTHPSTLSHSLAPSQVPRTSQVPTSPLPPTSTSQPHLPLSSPSHSTSLPVIKQEVADPPETPEAFMNESYDETETKPDVSESRHLEQDVAVAGPSGLQGSSDNWDGDNDLAGFAGGDGYSEGGMEDHGDSEVQGNTHEELMAIYKIDIKNEEIDDDENQVMVEDFNREKENDEDSNESRKRLKTMGSEYSALERTSEMKKEPGESTVQISQWSASGHSLHHAPHIIPAAAQAIPQPAHTPAAPTAAPHLIVLTAALDSAAPAPAVPNASPAVPTALLDRAVPDPAVPTAVLDPAAPTAVPAPAAHAPAVPTGAPHLIVLSAALDSAAPAVPNAAPAPAVPAAVIDPTIPTAVLDRSVPAPAVPAAVLDRSVPAPAVPTAVFDPAAPTAVLDQAVPDPAVPTAVFDPAAPTAVLDPAAPTAVLDQAVPDPAVPTAVFDPAAPTTVLDPAAPTAVLDPAAPTAVRAPAAHAPAASMVEQSGSQSSEGTLQQNWRTRKPPLSLFLRSKTYAKIPLLYRKTSKGKFTNTYKSKKVKALNEVCKESVRTDVQATELLSVIFSCTDKSSKGKKNLTEAFELNQVSSTPGNITLQEKDKVMYREVDKESKLTAPVKLSLVKNNNSHTLPLNVLGKSTQGNNVLSIISSAHSSDKVFNLHKNPPSASLTMTEDEILAIMTGMFGDGEGASDDEYMPGIQQCLREPPDTNSVYSLAHIMKLGQDLTEVCQPWRITQNSPEKKKVGTKHCLELQHMTDSVDRSHNTSHDKVTCGVFPRWDPSGDTFPRWHPDLCCGIGAPDSSTKIQLNKTELTPRKTSTGIVPTKPTVIPTTISTVLSTTKSTVMLTSQSTVMPTTKSTVMPTTRSTVMPTTRSTVMPTTRSTVMPTTRSTVMPTTRSTVMPTTRSTVMPTTRSTVIPTTRSTVMPTTRSTVMLTPNSIVIPPQKVSTVTLRSLPVATVARNSFSTAQSSDASTNRTSSVPTLPGTSRCIQPSTTSNKDGLLHLVRESPEVPSSSGPARTGSRTQRSSFFGLKGDLAVINKTESSFKNKSPILNRYRAALSNLKVCNGCGTFFALEKGLVNHRRTCVSMKTKVNHSCSLFKKPHEAK
ncbi:signaling mucin HKR1-like isoform X2 [Homarus americanus]|nr:signaling mucin HKR1-like isoform X2 [Homarus americanus]XP_042216705.1 signaling mucin HKR1-like isoform X2 [Homarus americanus]